MTALAYLILAAGLPAGSEAPAISGEYLEARTCDVYTGPCFANSQIDSEGLEATLAWKIQQGAWNGVALDGLAVVAVLQGSTTLGHHYKKQGPVHSVLLLDARADSRQRAALREFALAQLGDLAGEVVGQRTVAIELLLKGCGKSGCGSLKAGDLCRLKTRCLADGDHLCSNEEVFYPPLAQLQKSAPAYTVEHHFGGEWFRQRWTDRNSPSAFTGRFSVPAPAGTGIAAE